MSEPEHDRILREVFGFNDFRPGQRATVECLLRGEDAVVLLPTGGGKSLCYQVPAITLARQSGGLAVVISPLIALMGDQVRNLCARGVRAAALNSHQSDAQSREVFEALADGHVELLYVSPERASTRGFRAMLRHHRVCLVAIDEAHCVSQWGHDFRPEYLQLAELRDLCRAPMVAATATATPDVLAEVIHQLRLRNPHVERGDFRRPNLQFAVEAIRSHTARLQRLCDLLEAMEFRRTPSSGRAIIYCSTRKKTEEVAKHLCAHAFAAAAYHAGRDRGERRRVQRAFEMGRVRVLAATNAFGMGIDIPDVRLIVHFQTPGSLEAYYQEAGRAGRDGQPANCVMFFGTSDLATQRRIQSGTRASAALRTMEVYARAELCRQRTICDHFGMKDVPPCDICDVCKGFVREENEVVDNKTTALSNDELRVIISAVGGLLKPVGKVGLARALRGSRAKSLHKCGLMDLPEHGALHHRDETSIVAAIEGCLERGQLVRKGHKYPTVWLPGKAVRARQAWTAPNVGSNTNASRPLERRARRDRYTPVVKALDAFRRRKARELGWKPYMVLQKRTIVALDEQRPGSVWDLQQIPGLGEAKIERFGEELISIVSEHG